MPLTVGAFGINIAHLMPASAFSQRKKHDDSRPAIIGASINLRY